MGGMVFRGLCFDSSKSIIKFLTAGYKHPGTAWSTDWFVAAGHTSKNTRVDPEIVRALEGRGNTVRVYSANEFQNFLNKEPMGRQSFLIDDPQIALEVCKLLQPLEKSKVIKGVLIATVLSCPIATQEHIHNISGKHLGVNTQRGDPVREVIFKPRAFNLSSNAIDIALVIDF
jgi:hypothetical protein